MRPPRAHASALLGVPWDENSSFARGAADAPAAIRRVLFSGASNLWSESGIDVGAPGVLVDAGDVALAGDPMGAIERAVSDLLARGLRPIVLGGDHAITPFILRAFAPVHRPLTVLHLDAHPDLYDVFDGNRWSHACPFARIMEEGLAAHLVQVGIRTMNAHQRAQADRFGVTVIDMKHFDGVLPPLTAPLYLSIDLDGFDPAFAPGVNHPEPGGLGVREVLRMIDALPGPIVGADVVELNPHRDPSGITAALCAKLIKELVASPR